MRVEGERVAHGYIGFEIEEYSDAFPSIARPFLCQLKKSRPSTPRAAFDQD
jgi:hypothetical protein